jgi:flagellar motor switch protein FliN/FliY
MTKNTPDKQELREHEFSEVRRSDRAPTQHLELEDLKNVCLSMTVDLGSTPMLVREVLDLRCGSVIRLNKTAGEPTDVYIGTQVFSKGEVVVIGDGLHVRIGDIAGTEERSEDNSLGK